MIGYNKAVYTVDTRIKFGYDERARGVLSFRGLTTESTGIWLFTLWIPESSSGMTRGRENKKPHTTRQKELIFWTK